jgi:hypothetical protein
VTIMIAKFVKENKYQLTTPVSNQDSTGKKHTSYLAIGFATTFLALEAAWHFTACKIKDKRMKPCFYKQIGLLS